MNKIRALLIGVPRYERKDISDLEYCSNDVLGMSDVLFDSLGVTPNMITSIGEDKDELTTRKQILRKLKLLINQVTEEETLLFYFSGHGYSVEKENFLISSDTELDLIEETSISLEYVFNKIKNAKSKIKFIIIDSCHSGIHLSKSIGNGFKELNLKEIDAEGIVIFASSKGDELSFIEDKKEMSVFTHYLIKGLQGHAKLDREDRLSLDNLNKYVTSKVNEWAIENNSLQTPNIKMELAGTFYFNILTNNPFDLIKKDDSKEIVEKIKEFQAYLIQRGYKQSTIKNYCSRLQRFLISYLPFHWTEVMSKEVIEREIAEYVEFGHFGKTAANSLINSIKIFAQMEQIELEKLDYYKRPKSRNLNEPLTENQLIQLLNNIENLKHKTIVSLIYHGALSLNEIRNLKLTDINFETGWIEIEKDYEVIKTIQLEENVLNLINSYIKLFRPIEYLFNGLKTPQYSISSFQKIIKNNKEGIESKGEISARLLKKSRLANLISSGKSIKEINDLIGVTMIVK